MHTKLVSVVIPSYNHEKFIKSTINSIIEQTYSNIELIVIDDGSTDNTYKVLSSCRSDCINRFTRVYFAKQEHMGTALTLNHLVENVQGEYILFIASDDLLKPNAIETFIDFLEHNQEYGLVVGNNEIIDSNGEKCFWDKNRNIIYDETKATYKTFVDQLKSNAPYFTDELFGTYKTLYRGNYIPNGYMVRKSLFDVIEPFTKEAPLEDYYLMLQLSKYTRFKYIDNVYFSYRWHTNNSIKNKELIISYTNKTKKHEDELLKIINLNDCFQEVKEIDKRGIYQRRFGIPYILEIRYFRKNIEKIRVIVLLNIEVFSWKKIINLV